MSAEFIQSLGKRVESFLPNSTGYSVAEVELNPQFMVTRNILLSSSTSVLATDVFATFCGILDAINTEANNAELHDRSVNSIGSTLIVLKLLFEFVNRHWVSKRDQPQSSASSIISFSSSHEQSDSSRLSSLTSQNFDYSRPFNFASYYHYEPPKKMKSEIIHPCVETIISLFSTQMVKRTMGLVKKSPVLSSPPSSRRRDDETLADDVQSVPSLSTIKQQHKGHLNHHHHNDADDTASIEATTTTTTQMSSSTPGTAASAVSAFVSKHVTMPSSSSNTNASFVSHTSNANTITASSGTTTQKTANGSAKDSAHETAVKLIADVDNYCSILLKYLAVANPGDYYAYIDLKLFGFSRRGQAVPSKSLFKYAPLIEFIFYDQMVGEGMATVISNFLPYIKSNTWRQIVLVFYCNSIKDQCFSRPEDYNAIVQAGSELEQTCKNMFDYVTTIFESNQHIGASSMVQAWLVILCLSDFIELANKPNKLKITFNRRLKFLTQILKDSHNLHNLESFDSLIHIFYLAARLAKYLPGHPVVKFCEEYLDTTYDALHKLNVSFNTKEASVLFDNLLINLNVVAVMINPNKYIQILIGKYYQSQGHIKEMRILVKVVKGLSELKKSQIEFDKIMYKLKNSLKSTIYAAVKLLTNQQKGPLHKQHNSLKYSKSISSSGQVQHNLQSHPQLDAQSLRSYDSSSSGRNHPNRSSHASISSRKNSTDMLSPSPSVRQLVEQSQSNLDEEITTKQAAPSTMSSSTNASTSSPSTSNSSSTSSSPSTESIKTFEATEEILTELFYIFISVPETYFIDMEYLNKTSSTSNGTQHASTSIHISTSEYLRIQKFCAEITNPLRYAFQSPTTSDSLLDAASALAISLVFNEFEGEISANPKALFCNYLSSNYIINYIIDTCLGLPLTDSKFKACFIFLNKFLEHRDKVLQNSPLLVEVLDNLDPACKLEVGGLSCHSLEKIFLLSLCTHDIQFFNIAKSSMHWYVEEVKLLNDALFRVKKEQDQDFSLQEEEEYVYCYNTNLYDKILTIMNDDSVFTGFVSLHKKFRNLMRDVEPSQSTFEVWLLIFNRWLDMLEAGRSNVTNNADVENLVFRHYTGYLVSSSGSFMQDSFLQDDIIQKHKVVDYICQFFEKCILLLTSEDLVIRVIVKDALSNEPHPAVYQLICTKLVEIIKNNLDTKFDEDNDESILFIEQVITVMTSMIGVKNDGSFILVALLPDICELIVKFVNQIEDLSTTLRLKIRFCKLGAAIDTDKERVGLRGAFKLRNGLTRANLDWLQQAVFFEEEYKRGNITTASSISSSSTAENMYLNIDLASECSKCLAVQLEHLTLEIPEGTRDKDVKKAKEIVFANYFALFYKILQKYTYADSSVIKSKYKIHLITENVLKCISNILQTDTDIGMQFVLPLGFHENNKIRSIFLNVFANIFSKRKFDDYKEEFPPEVFETFTKLSDICGSAARIASSSEHNLLASSLFAVFGYTNRLDKLFHTLLQDEIANVARSTDIFRRNSTLTRLLSNFAKDYGADYLVKTLAPFVEDLNNKGVYFEVEKAQQPSETPTEELNDLAVAGVDADAEQFMIYFRKLVNAITSSVDIAPKSFKFICKEIYTCVKAKGNNENGLIAVGSYLFLRFLCPAIISPEVFLNIPLSKPKVKRTLMQLVKMIQNIVNGSLAVKWPRLQHKSNELDEINKEIFDFLLKMSQDPSQLQAESLERRPSDQSVSGNSMVSDSSSILEDYPFQQILEAPYPEMRYLHKFFYHYFVNIKNDYMFSESLGSTENTHRRISRFCIMDGLLYQLGQPKSLLSLQLNSTFKYASVADNDTNPHFTDFMGKMALKYAEISPDMPLVHTTIYEDGTPVIVVNLELLKTQLNNDVELLVFRLFEFCSQVWDNKFYIVYDFTESDVGNNFCDKYLTLMQFYATEQFMRNCARLYYFNIPIFHKSLVMKSMLFFRQAGRSSSQVKIYTYTVCNGPEIVGKLGLSQQTMSTLQDTRVAFHNVKLFDFESGKFISTTVKIGRKWIQLCSEDIFSYDAEICETTEMQPVLVRKLTEITKCEVTPLEGEHAAEHAQECQFTIQFNNDEQLILMSPKRSEIIRFLYFATSRLPTTAYNDELEEVSGGAELDSTPMDVTNDTSKNGAATGGAVVGINKNNEQVVPFLWFSRLYHSVFQALLCQDEDVRQSAAYLFAALSAYFDMDMGISVEHSKNIAFPANTTDFIVATSRFLASQKPELSYRFFRAFFEYYDKMPVEHRISAIMYISPWIENVGDYIYLSDSEKNGHENGTSRTIDIIRLFCRISATDRDQVPCINDYVWKKLFSDPRLVTLLIDEIIAFAIDNINEGPEWSFIIAVITPSIDVCGELISRLMKAVSETDHSGSLVAAQSKLIEISVLLKVCSVIFFDSYSYAQTYVAEVFFFCTLFVSHPSLDNVGSDLQKFLNNTIQSFLHKPDITKREVETIDELLRYLASQRAHLLFGMKRDASSSQYSLADPAQIYNRATSFEILCDSLSKFMSELGESTDLLARWRSRWCTNAIDIAFKRSSLFQSRSLLIVGILSKAGIGDSLASRVLKITSRESSDTLAHLTSILVSNSRIVQGLSNKSILTQYLFWPALCLSLLDNIVLYQPSTHCLLSVLHKIVDQFHSESTSFVDKVFECRPTLEPYVNIFEKAHNMHFNPGNIDIHIFFAFAKGLKVSHIKHSSLDCLMSYTKLRLKYDTPINSEVILPYLVFIYLSTPEAQFKEFIAEIDTKRELSMNGPGAPDDCTPGVPPKFILDFFLSGSYISSFVLVQAGFFYKSDNVDTIFKTNFLNLYKDLLYLKKSVGYLIIKIVKDQLQKMLIHSNSIAHVETISEILLYSIEDGRYNDNKILEEMKVKFEADKICGIASSGLTKLNEKVDEKKLIEKIHCIEEMTYRAACSYVEGQNLED